MPTQSRNRRAISPAGDESHLVVEPHMKMPFISNICNNYPVQQDDSSKEFYLSIVQNGIPSTYKKYGPHDTFETVRTLTAAKHVIVVGAGAAGLSAAYELAKAGQSITIFERQNRVGGRMKTIRTGLSHGLKAEGGAMRLPYDHFLTHAYIKKFGVKLRPFTNYNPKGILKISDHNPITIGEWESENKKYSDLFFEGWDRNIPDAEKNNVKGILDYYKKTLEPVKQELYSQLEKPGADPNTVWNSWVEKWSVISLEDFLRTDRLQDENSPKYRPWSKEAFYGYTISSYNPLYNINLVETLRDDLGDWWVHKLQTPEEGMTAIADAFIDPVRNGGIDLYKMIMFGYEVTEVKRVENSSITVVAKNPITGHECKMNGDAAIVTVSLPILRQINIDLDTKRKLALADIHYEPSTKILLQCRTRFWESQLGKGGFSKTNLPIGQIHYPSAHDPIDKNNKRGILVIYTWGQDALLFGSQSSEEAIASAVQQVKTIHPEIVDEFEVGVMQAWYSDPTTQGAFAQLNPYQYCDGLKTLMNHPEPSYPIYLAGEAISFTNGWIQGAIESGLRAAYLLFTNQRRRVNELDPQPETSAARPVQQQNRSVTPRRRFACISCLKA